MVRESTADNSWEFFTIEEDVVGRSHGQSFLALGISHGVRRGQQKKQGTEKMSRFSTGNTG